MRPVIVIAGPTASGKTGAAIEVAHRLDGEIISADSRQIYRYMDIGTAKPTDEERAAAPHHLIDVIDPDATYSASAFADAAAALIDEIEGRSRQPIVAGGSGFYLEALFRGLSPIPEVAEDVHREVVARVEADATGAFEELERVDPVAASRLKPTDPQRVARALEVHAQTGKPLSHFQDLPRVPATSREAAWFGLERDREALYARTDARVHAMVANGLVEEVEGLVDRGYGKRTTALATFGYREILALLAGETTMEQAVTDIQQATRRYAKRQMTWFRNRAQLAWLDADDAGLADRICEAVEGHRS